MPTALVLNDTSHMNHHGCTRVMSNLREGLRRHGFRIAGSWHGLSFVSDPQFHDALQTADALVVNGEGTIHHSRRAAEALVSSARLAESAGCPAFLINTTWQANSRELARAAGRFAMVCVRESLSSRELQQNGIAAQVVPDLTFLSGPQPWQTRNTRIGVTDSTRKTISRALFRYAAAASDRDYLPVLAPFRAVPGMPKRIRKTARHAAFAACGRIPLLRRAVPVRYRALKFAVPDADSYLHALATRAGVITGRFHSLCFALQTATPFLAVRSNSHKMEALLTDAGLSLSRLIRPEHLGPSLGARPDLIALSDVEFDRMRKYVESAPGRIDAMFSRIAHMCGAERTHRRTA